MPALFLFLFKVNIALVLFCLGYYAVLRHLTFYTLNRIYLVVAIIFSTLYPNITLTDFAQSHQQLTEPVQTVIVNWKTPAENFVKPLYQPNYWQWVEVIFWAGVILFAIRLMIQLFSLFRLYRKSQPGQIEEHTVRLLKDDIGPFSFWRSIYINPTKLSPSELKNVLEHEQVHVSQWHTLDLLLAELSTIFYWFNPGVWLMKKAVRENIEFITDRKILQKGTDSKEYQYSLVSVSLATMPNTIVNHFNISTIKKRIIMMNTKRSSGYNITRYVFLVPAVVALLLVFSLSKAEISKKGLHTIKSIATAISNVAITDNDRPNPAHIKTTKPALAKKVNITADTIYSGKAKDGKKSFMVMADANADSINYVINGTKATKAEVKALDPARINSIELLTAKTAKQFYPELDNDKQVMFVTT
ncbi:MAG TPA: M56 family metallopeptidase, partial [Mucilaginibacter sp.]|nr:M56 family metallopeptidase [Mucilaginibacter sp.]